MTATIRFLVVILLVSVSGLYIHLHENVPVPPRKPLAELPLVREPWRMTAEGKFSAAVLDILKPTDYLSRSYRGDGMGVTLYVGYHSGAKGEGGIHSPRHCLPGSGWFEISSTPREVAVPGGKVNLVQAVYQKGEQKEVFLYWFQVGRHSLSDEYALKLAEIANSFLRSRSDSAFIRVSVPFETDEAAAVAAGERFIRDFYTNLMGLLPL